MSKSATSLTPNSLMKCKRVIRTRYFTFLSENPFVFSRWSCSRPGVQTITCGRLESAIDWDIMSIPPTMTAHRTPIVAPRASICWPIWYASSLTRPEDEADKSGGRVSQRARGTDDVGSAGRCPRERRGGGM